MSKLEVHFPKRAKELQSYCASQGRTETYEEVSARVWNLCQLWLTFLDGDDCQLTLDESVYKRISNLANSAPRCSIEEEAGSWMQLAALEMTDTEIELALWCAVDHVGTILVLNGNFDDTLQILLNQFGRRGTL